MPDVLQGAAHAGLLVALEVGQGDEHVRIHDGPADLGALDVLAALHRAPSTSSLPFSPSAMRTWQPVVVGGEAIDIGGLQVVQGILPAAHIQGVAVGQEGLAALVLHQVHHHLGPVGPQVGQVARLAEVHLDGDVLAIHVDVTEAGGHHQPRQLLGQVLPPAGAAEIREINLCLFHAQSLLFSAAKPPPRRSQRPQPLPFQAPPPQKAPFSQLRKSMRLPIYMCSGASTPMSFRPFFSTRRVVSASFSRAWASLCSSPRMRQAV